MAEPFSWTAIAIAVASAAATAAVTVTAQELLREEPEFELELPSFGTPASGGSAVPIIRDLIVEQTSFLNELLPGVINPLQAGIADQTRIEAAILKLFAETMPPFAEGMADIAGPLSRHFSPHLAPLAETMELIAKDTTGVMIPGIAGAAGALMKIVEALLKGEALPADSLLTISRDVLVLMRTTLGKDAAPWIGPLTTIITQTLPKVLGQQGRRLDELDFAEEALDPEVRMGFAGVPIAAAALLPALWKALLWALAILGPMFGKEILDVLGKKFPQLREVVVSTGATTAETLFDSIELLHLAGEATMAKGSAVLFGRIDRKLDELAGAGDGEWQRVAPELLSLATGLGMSAHLVSVLAEKFALFKALGFPQLAAFMVDMAGFGRIAQNTVGVQMDTALRSPGLRHARRRFRSELPGPGVFDQLYLERKVDDTAFRDYYAAQGWPEELIEAHREAVFREAPPRELAIVFEDAAIDEAWVDRHLREQGYSDEDAAVLLGGVKARSQRGPRQALIAAVVDAYEAGLYDEALVVEYLQELRLRDDTLGLVLDAARHRRFLRTQESRRKALERAAAIGQFTEEAVRAELAALGYDEGVQSLAARLVGIAQSREIFEDERGELRASIRRVQAKQIETALDLHRRFELDDGQLGGVLRGYGVRDSEVDALVALAAVKRTPVPKLPTTLSPEALVQAKLDQMADQVLALQAGDVINEATALGMLVGLGLDAETAGLRAGLVAARRAGPQLEEAERKAATTARERKQEQERASAAAARASAAAATAAERERERAAAQARADEAARKRQADQQLAEILRDRENAAIALYRRGELEDDRLYAQLVALGRSTAAAEALVDLESARRRATRP